MRVMNEATRYEAQLFYSIMGDLLSTMERDDTEMRSMLIEKRREFQVLAQMCRYTGYFQRSKIQSNELKQHLEESTPPEDRLAKSCFWLMDLIVNWPASLHMQGAVRLYVVLVALYLE